MRYIGNKLQMLNNIQTVINDNISSAESLLDIFSGSATVARYFKDQYRIISNDNLFFSFTLQKATIEIDEIPQFKLLSSKLGVNLEDFLNNIDTYYDNRFHNDSFFITKNYSPVGNRMYLTTENSKIIDLWRLYINQWFHENLISEDEYYYLIARIIETVPFYSNISGTYGAYLKTWDKRALKKIKLVDLPIKTNHKKNKSYNLDALEVLDKVNGDILYMDPPYNERQYLPNYHLLETIARYDNPTIKGVTGIREYNHQKSNFCVTNKAYEELDKILNKANFKHVILSYSTDGIMEANRIIEIMSKYSKTGKCNVYRFPQRRFKSRKLVNESDLYELIFYIEKAQDREAKISFIKSPFNYTGGKYKILNQILPLFPTDINNFVDLFSGGLNVTLNVFAKKYIAIDINSKLIEMMEHFKNSNQTLAFENIDKIIEDYNLSKDNLEGYNKLRDDYNCDPTPLKLFTLTCYSFNHVIRFNNSFKFNTPFGKNRSSYNQNIKKNLNMFIQKVKDKDINFVADDFINLDFSRFDSETFVYADPPYLISNASYNDGQRGYGDWNDKKDQNLLDLLDKLNDKGIKFALSNVFEHNGMINDRLIKWSKKYIVHFIDYNYNNSNYQSKAKNFKTKEVLICNYEVKR